MRAPVAAVLSLAAMALGAGLVACFDLFHATDDVLTACQLDAQSPGCGDASGDGGAGADAGTDFCKWSEQQANTNAEHACAWLGACEGPTGQNAFGACMFEALLAYDCAANPSHPVTGERHARWDCLWSATTCAQVDACVLPGGSVNCNGKTGTACASGQNAEVRVDCPDGGAGHGENCALWGQTCAGGGGSPVFCGGDVADAALSCSHTDQCIGDQIHSCSGSVDIGIDCRTNGAGHCGGFPAGPSPSWIACLPASDAGGPCTPARDVTCVGGVATSCPAGTQEALDCAAILHDGRGCTPGQLQPTWDWTSPCVVNTATGDGGVDAAIGDGGTDASSCAESCSGTTITGCARGTTYGLDCHAVGLGPCAMVTTDPGQPGHAACGPP